MKKWYLPPRIEVVNNAELCQIPVHMGSWEEGPGDVGAKETDFDDDFFDKNFLPSELNNVWEE